MPHIGVLGLEGLEVLGLRPLTTGSNAGSLFPAADLSHGTPDSRRFYLRRDPRRDDGVRNLTDDDGAGANDDVSADGRSVRDDHVRAEPRAVADVDAARGLALLQHRNADPVLQVIATDQMR